METDVYQEGHKWTNGAGGSFQIMGRHKTVSG